MRLQCFATGLLRLGHGCFEIRRPHSFGLAQLLFGFYGSHVTPRCIGWPPPSRTSQRPDPSRARSLIRPFGGALSGSDGRHGDTIGNQLEEARRPIADEDIKRLSKASADGAWRATAALVQAHIWRSILIAVAASLLLLTGAFGAGYWFHGSQQLVAGVSAGGQECHAQQGGTICFIPVWAKLPPSTAQ